MHNLLKFLFFNLCTAIAAVILNGYSKTPNFRGFLLVSGRREAYSDKYALTGFILIFQRLPAYRRITVLLRFCGSCGFFGVCGICD